MFELKPLLSLTGDSLWRTNTTPEALGNILQVFPRGSASRVEGNQSLGEPGIMRSYQT